MSLYAYIQNNPVMYSDISGYSREWWNNTKEWFKNTFGFSGCKEASTVDYKFFYGLKTGSGHCTQCDKPVVFYSSIPDDWSKIGQYSFGIKFTSQSGKGFKIATGTKASFGWFGNGSSTTVSLNIYGRLGIRESFSSGNGYYSFAEGEFNTPETVGVALGIAYGINYLVTLFSKLLETGTPKTNPVYGSQ